MYLYTLKMDLRCLYAILRVIVEQLFLHHRLTSFCYNKCRKKMYAKMLIKYNNQEHIKEIKIMIAT